VNALPVLALLLVLLFGVGVGAGARGDDGRICSSGCKEIGQRIDR